MNFFEFLSTPDGQRTTAFVTTFIIGLAFVFGTHPFKKKKNRPHKQPIGQALWVAGDYYTFLRADIMTCPTFVELEQLREAVEGIFYKKFRAPITQADRNRYYTRLMEAITQRENALEGELLAGIHPN